MSLGVIASIVVGVAFLLAGAAKVVAGPGWSAQAAALGAPGPVVPFVPWTEIVVGAGLCAQLSRPMFGGVSMLMLVAFSALLGTKLARGQHPPCACFGSWSAKPLSWRHLARNVVLMAVAAVAIAV